MCDLEKEEFFQSESNDVLFIYIELISVTVVNQILNSDVPHCIIMLQFFLKSIKTSFWDLLLIYCLIFKKYCDKEIIWIITNIVQIENRHKCFLDKNNLENNKFYVTTYINKLLISSSPIFHYQFCVCFRRQSGGES